MRTADLWSLEVVLGDTGGPIPRFINFRAVIPLDEAQLPGHRGVITLRIEADDVTITWDGYAGSYLFETDLPGIRVGDGPEMVLPAAMKALAEEGFRLSGVGWTVSDNGYGAGIEAIA